jgi:ammonia channel protein AmtB
MGDRSGCKFLSTFAVTVIDVFRLYQRQIVGALFIIGWNIVWTSLILLFIKHVLRVPLRMTEEQLLAGDNAIHAVGHHSDSVPILSTHCILMEIGGRLLF